MKRKKMIELDLKLVRKLEELGHMGMTLEDVIEKLATHALICNPYWNYKKW